MSAISQIEVIFPVPVTLTNDEQREIHDVIEKICSRYEAENPGRVMWVFGYGQKITWMPMTADEEKERGMEFDEHTLSIEVSEREDYKNSTPSLEEGHLPQGRGGPDIDDQAAPGSISSPIKQSGGSNE